MKEREPRMLLSHSCTAVFLAMGKWGAVVLNVVCVSE